jgi:hypothetical protein
MKSLMIDIHNWIVKISTKKKELGGYSVCPFAKSAKYKVFEVNLNEIVPDLFELDYDIIVFALKQKISINELKNKCRSLNKKYTDYVFLPEHKKHKTLIKNIQTNNGKHNLIICQYKKELNKAREILKKTNYYKNWSKKYLKEIMSYGK